MIRIFRHRRAVSAMFRQPLLLGLLVLAMVVRGLIPAGYMPSGSQSGHGLFPLELCAADKSVKVVLLSLSGDDAAQASPDASQEMQDCVFAGLGGASLHNGLHDVVQVAVLADDDTAFAINRSVSHLRFMAGAPLGSRAPPLV